LPYGRTASTSIPFIGCRRGALPLLPLLLVGRRALIALHAAPPPPPRSYSCRMVDLAKHVAKTM
jgi:hypothetical protein